MLVRSPHQCLGTCLACHLYRQANMRRGNVQEGILSRIFVTRIFGGHGEDASTPARNVGPRPRDFVSRDEQMGYQTRGLLISFDTCHHVNSSLLCPGPGIGAPGAMPGMMPQIPPGPGLLKGALYGWNWFGERQRCPRVLSRTKSTPWTARRFRCRLKVNESIATATWACHLWVLGFGCAWTRSQAACRRPADAAQWETKFGAMAEIATVTVGLI